MNILATRSIAASVFAIIVATISFPTAAAGNNKVDYWCKVNIGSNVNTCKKGPVIVTQPGGIRRIATIDLDAAKPWRTLVVRTRVRNVSGFAVQIADSPTNNGYGGDSASTSHDAEAHFVGAALQVYRSDAGSFAAPSNYLICQFAQPNTSRGIRQEWRIANDILTFYPNLATEQPPSICNNAGLFDFPPYDEVDEEDPRGLYEDKLYVGLNGVITGGRSGTGVEKVCFYLSMEDHPTQEQVTQACGF